MPLDNVRRGGGGDLRGHRSKWPTLLLLLVSPFREDSKSSTQPAAACGHGAHLKASAARSDLITALISEFHARKREAKEKTGTAKPSHKNVNEVYYLFRHTPNGNATFN